MRLDPETGDFIWNGSLDLAPVVGDAILRQRISTRLKIEYGSFIYEPDLGSRLRLVLGMGVPDTDQNIEMLIRDALEPMTDIVVLDVVIAHPDSHTAQATINYQAVGDTDVYSSMIRPEAQTTILLPG